MLILALLLVVYAFFFLGAVAFVLCTLCPALQRFAFSVALWFAVLGFCVVFSTLVLGGGFLTVALGQDHFPVHSRFPAFVAGASWFVTGLCLIVSIGIASLAARLHQELLHRLPFALFRLYATAIAGGIGSVFGWALMVNRPWHDDGHTLLYSGVAFIALVSGFAAAAYRYAHRLLGRAPQSLT